MSIRSHSKTGSMNKILQRIVTGTVLKKRKKELTPKEQFSQYDLLKGYMQLKTLTARKIKDTFLIAAGIMTAAFGLEGFLLPSNFIDGGATGTALLTSEITAIPLSLLLVIINLPFVFLGYKLIGAEFALKTALAITGLAACVTLVHFPVITHDKLLVAVFGGVCLGSGIACL